MKSSSWLKPTLSALLLLAVAAYGAFWPPWPLRVLQNDLAIAFRASPTALVLLRFAVTIALLGAAVVIGLLLARLVKRNWMCQGLAILLVATAVASYLPVKNAIIGSHWARAVANGGTLVVVKRSAYLPEDSRIVSLVLKTSQERVGLLPQSNWPFNFVSEKSQVAEITEGELRELVEALQRVSFFALPQELAPGPRLKPEGYYVALFADGETFRVFGRSGEPGFDVLLHSGEAVRSRAPEHALR